MTTTGGGATYHGSTGATTQFVRPTRSVPPSAITPVTHSLPTLAGNAQLKIPAGTQPGTVFSLKGKGIKNLQGYGFGDLHVRVLVEVPSRLNAAQKAKLQEFADLCDGEVNPISKSFFEKAKNLFR